MRIAVVGSGIAGLGAAWALSRSHEVTVFEAAGRAGGHANTVDLEIDGRLVPVDTGFIVYNERNYPHLVALFQATGVATAPSDMSFAVSLEQGRREYAGSLGGLFAQPSNALRARHWRMIGDLLRFYREAPAVLEAGHGTGENLGDYLRRAGYSDPFVHDHLLPMAAAIWSCPIESVLTFPLRSFVQFLHNHGLLLIDGRPAWRTVSGGSREYVRRVSASFAKSLHLATPVRELCRNPAGVVLRHDRGEMRFDHVVLATHADQALAIIGADAHPLERKVLNSFRYSRNWAVLHRDPALMPRRRAVWSSWNYMTGGGQEQGRPAAVTYWMNRLQNIPGPDIFVSLNPLSDPAPSLVGAEFTYDHPMFDAAAIEAQSRLPEIQGRRRTWFCGSYCGYGFHEDGLEAGLAVAGALGAPVPWADEVVATSPAAGIAALRPNRSRAAAA